MMTMNPHDIRREYDLWTLRHWSRGIRAHAICLFGVGIVLLLRALYEVTILRDWGIATTHCMFSVAILTTVVSLAEASKSIRQVADEFRRE